MGGGSLWFLNGQPNDLQRRVGARELSFYVRPENTQRLNIRFSQIRDEGLKSFRLYRDEHKKLIDAGEIWNPDFIEHMKKYDVIRTMDFQRINGSPVTKFSEVALPGDAFYANALMDEWPAPPRYGMPYEILFDLANKADAALWLHIPPLIGAPLHPGHPSLRNDKGNIGIRKVSAMASSNAKEIIDSPTWDEFTKELADRLVASGYSPEKPLYIEIGNEIWNNARPFSLNTSYFRGIGRGLRNDWRHREAYGAVLARFANSFEEELKRRSLDYNVTYVLASHTANVSATTKAIEGFNYQVESMQADADALIAKTGLALTSYTRCSASFSKQRFKGAKGKELIHLWEKAIDENAESLKRELHDFCVTASGHGVLSLQYIVKSWRLHQEAARKNGMRLIGAYEGGSHDQPDEGLKESKKFAEWWLDFHWGHYGADIIRQTNLALINEFPGVMLSDFSSMGPVGRAPWVEGHYAYETDLLRVWDEFSRPQAAKHNN